MIYIISHSYVKLTGGKVISEFYHEGIDVLGRNNEIYSCKYVNVNAPSIYFYQQKDLNNERNEAIKNKCIYYLVLINPSWILSIIIRAIYPYDLDKVVIRKREVFKK